MQLTELLNNNIDICARERCPVSFVGTVTNDGHVKLIEDCMENFEKYENNSKEISLPFDLSLEAVLGKINIFLFQDG